MDYVYHSLHASDMSPSSSGSGDGSEKEIQSCVHWEFNLIGIPWTAWLYVPRIPLHKSKMLFCSSCSSLFGQFLSRIGIKSGSWA